MGRYSGLTGRWDKKEYKNKNTFNKFVKIFQCEVLKKAFKIIKYFGDELQGLLVGIGLISFALFIQFSNHKVHDLSDLRSLEVVLVAKPKYDTSWVKGVTYRSIEFKAFGYKKDFRITNFTFRSTDHDRLKAELDVYDTVSFWIPETDIKSLKRNELVNNYNEVFGLVYKGYNYVDFEGKNSYQKAQNKWSKILIGFFGILILAENIRKLRRRALAESQKISDKVANELPI